MEINPYYNLEVEETLIGSLLIDGDLIKDCTIRPEHFNSHKLRKIFTMMLRLAEKGKPVDMVSVADEAGPKHLDNIGGASYLSPLAAVSQQRQISLLSRTGEKVLSKKKSIEIAHRSNKRQLKRKLNRLKGWNSGFTKGGRSLDDRGSGVTSNRG